MLPVLEGMIARRILLNFRADPEITQRLVPKPLEVEVHNGYAIVGICLIRLEQLRPKCAPAFMGLSSENMAHRVAIRYRGEDGMKPGVFIWRRDTNKKFMEWLGGRMFPGVHHSASFHVHDQQNALGMYVHTADGHGGLAFAARKLKDFKPTRAFSSFDEASEFFRQGDCGFSCSLQNDHLEGMRLNTSHWHMEPLEFDLKYSAFFSDEQRFPPGSIEPDLGLLMRGIPHEWYELNAVPELAGAYLADTAAIAS